MKRLSEEQKSRAIAVANKRWQKSLRRQSHRTEVRHQEELQNIPIKVDAPDTLSFSRNFEGTVQFLNRFRHAALDSSQYARRRLSVDLTPIRDISIPATIILAAEFHRWALIKRTTLTPRGVKNWSPRLRGLFDDLGVYDLLSIDAPITDDSVDDNITLTPLKSGERFEGEKIDSLQRSFQDDIQGFTARPDLYDGLVEAAENAIAHAYPPADDFTPKFPFAGQRWWGAGCLDPIAMRLRFFIYDQGAGIPYTLPRSEWAEQLRAILSSVSAGWFADDGRLLRAALELGRTRTDQPNRGKGLQRMCEIVLSTHDSYMRILSGRGEVRIWSDGRVKETTHSMNIGGTLVEWSFPADAFSFADPGDIDDV